MIHTQTINTLRTAINSIFIGKEEVVEQILTAFFAGGHVLIEDVPGVGKTTLASLLAAVMECSFGRIQFTPDTLPGDIEGISIYNQKTGDFEYRKGVVMNQILLADEINRTAPKTQAALLEAMGEGQVSVDGKIYPLPQPFMVIATQNPTEFIGTYPLPEAQLDRFMMRLSIGYATRDEEIRMAKSHLAGKTLKKAIPIMKATDVMKIREEVEKVIVSEKLFAYIADMIRLTRDDERFIIGASPRALLSLLKASQAAAFLEGRDFVKPDDAKKMAPLVLLHRLALTPAAKLQKTSASTALRSIIAKTPIDL